MTYVLYSIPSSDSNRIVALLVQLWMAALMLGVSSALFVCATCRSVVVQQGLEIETQLARTAPLPAREFRILCLKFPLWRMLINRNADESQLHGHGASRIASLISGPSLQSHKFEH